MEHEWVIDDRFILDKALIYIQRKPNLEKLSVYFDDSTRMEEEMLDPILLALSKLAETIVVKVDMADFRCIRRLMLYPMKQPANLHFKFAYNNFRNYTFEQDLIYKFFEIYTGMIKLEEKDIVSVFNNLGNPDNVITWHVSQSYLPSSNSTVQYYNMKNLVMETMYNFGTVENDIVFHTTQLIDNYFSRDDCDYTKHILAFKRFYRLESVKFTCFDPIKLLDLATVVSEQVDVHFGTSSFNTFKPSLVTLAISLFPRKIKIIVAGKNKVDVVCGSIIWLRSKCLGANVDIVGIPEWTIPPLNVLYEQLRDMNASVYNEFMNV